MKSGLIIVDLQNDFLPGGALAVNLGDEIIPLVNELVSLPFSTVVATKDWHPADHISFAQNHAGKKPGDKVAAGPVEQLLWPRHCVIGSYGAEFGAGWDTTKVSKIIYKGVKTNSDSYSTFFDNEGKSPTGLDSYLKEQGVKNLYIAGLATDYCVKYSVIDALSLGFNTHVIVDACRGVNLHPDDSNNALRLMEKAGASLTLFSDVMSKSSL